MAMNGLNVGKGLGIRPSRPTDKPFLQQLHNSTRDDLRLIDKEPDYIEGVIQMQYRAQTEGYGAQFPNAMYFVVEKHQEPIGRVVIDFGHNEVRLIDIAFIQQARGKGFGEAVVRGLQQAAAQVRAPMSLSVLSQNRVARNLYMKLGFIVESTSPPYDFMVWYPASNRVMV
jgi:ribosomal protein S18 acetylase RimI-like enzyme